MFTVYMFYNYYENLYIEFVIYDVCSINRTRLKQSVVTVLVRRDRVIVARPVLSMPRLIKRRKKGKEVQVGGKRWPTKIRNQQKRQKRYIVIIHMYMYMLMLLIVNSCHACLL